MASVLIQGETVWKLCEVNHFKKKAQNWLFMIKQKQNIIVGTPFRPSVCYACQCSNTASVFFLDIQRLMVYTLFFDMNSTHLLQNSIFSHKMLFMIISIEVLQEVKHLGCHRLIAMLLYRPNRKTSWGELTIISF